jgi:hypothetical protein
LAKMSTAEFLVEVEGKVEQRERVQSEMAPQLKMTRTEFSRDDRRQSLQTSLRRSRRRCAVSDRSRLCRAVSPFSASTFTVVLDSVRLCRAVSPFSASTFVTGVPDRSSDLSLLPSFVSSSALRDRLSSSRFCRGRYHLPVFV